MTVSEIPGVARNSLSQPNIWLTVLLTSLLCILPVVAFRFILLLLRPTINDKVRVQTTHQSLFVDIVSKPSAHIQEIRFSLALLP